MSQVLELTKEEKISSGVVDCADFSAESYRGYGCLVINV